MELLELTFLTNHYPTRRNNRDEKTYNLFSGYLHPGWRRQSRKPHL